MNPLNDEKYSIFALKFNLEVRHLIVDFGREKGCFFVEVKILRMCRLTLFDVTEIGKNRAYNGL